MNCELYEKRRKELGLSNRQIARQISTCMDLVNRPPVDVGLLWKWRSRGVQPTEIHRKALEWVLKLEEGSLK